MEMPEVVDEIGWPKMGDGTMGDGTGTVHMTWPEFDGAIDTLYRKIRGSGKTYTSVYGVPRGGLCAAVKLSHLLKIPLVTDRNFIWSDTLVVDDIADTGLTLSKFLEEHYNPDDVDSRPDTAVLYWQVKCPFKPTYHAIEKVHEDWIQFPWELD